MARHLVWLLQVVYSNQTGQITVHSDVSREFCIKAGVRQGCVLSLRLFCSVLQLAMQEWRSDVLDNGLDLGDGGPPLLDLRFVDDILLFPGSAEQLGYMLDELVTSLGKVGLKLNAAKTKALTTQAQPPKTLTALVWRLQCWTSRRPISGWAVCCRRKMQADDRTILTTDYKVQPVHSMFTNGFFVTKWFQWHLD